MKRYLLETLQEALNIWITLAIGILSTSILYAILNVSGVPKNSSLLIAFLALLGLILSSQYIVPGLILLGRQIARVRPHRKHSRPAIRGLVVGSANVETVETQEQIDPAVDSPVLLALYSRVMQLEAQAWQDPQAIVPLIEIYEQIIRRLDPSKNPLFYPAIQNSLGFAYSRSPAGNRTENLKRAIACYEEALHVWTPDTNPSMYALVQNNMGLAYSDLLIDDARNIEAAITCYKEALRFRTPETTPLAYAQTIGNLGIAYYRLPLGNKVANAEQGIEYFKKALDFQTPETAPIEYARTQTNLGAAYSMFPTDDPAQRKVYLTEAIACYKKALRFQSPKTVPYDYAHTRYNLSLARKRLQQLD